jgi:hypothetical protein
MGWQERKKKLRMIKNKTGGWICVDCSFAQVPKTSHRLGKYIVIYKRTENILEMKDHAFLHIIFS